MKYFDKNTIKNAANWHQRQFENDDSRFELKQKNAFKKALRIFSYKIDDKFWWNSLTDDVKGEAYRTYYDEYDLWYSGTGTGSGHSSYRFGFAPDIDIKKEEFTQEEHDRRIERLKEIFFADTIRRRELVINDIIY